MFATDDPFIQAVEAEHLRATEADDLPTPALNVSSFILEMIEAINEMRHAVTIYRQDAERGRRLLTLMLATAHLDLFLFADLHGMSGALDSYYRAPPPANRVPDSPFQSFEDGFVDMIAALGRLANEEDPKHSAALLLRLSRAMRAMWFMARNQPEVAQDLQSA